MHEPWRWKLILGMFSLSPFFLPSLSLWMFKYAFICLCVKPRIHYFICRWWCNRTQYAGVRSKGATKTTQDQTYDVGSKFGEIRQVFFFRNKFALSSYHSWIFRAVKWENIKLNYACMKQWKSAVGHCSFSSVFFSATWSSQQNPCLISAHDKCPDDLQTPDLGMYVGCCYTAVHSAAQ